MFIRFYRNHHDVRKTQRLPKSLTLMMTRCLATTMQPVKKNWQWVSACIFSSIPPLSVFQFHTVIISVSVPYRHYQCFCSIPSLSVFLFHTVIISVSVPYRHYQCFCSLPSLSVFLFHTVIISVSVPYHHYQCFCSIPSLSVFQFHTIIISVSVPYHHYQCFSFIPSLSVFHSAMFRLHSTNKWEATQQYWDSTETTCGRWVLYLLSSTSFLQELWYWWRSCLSLVHNTTQQTQH